MDKTNIGLVEYCKQQLGLPYWWGTFGQIATQSLYEQKKRQYPSQYTANNFTSQFGKRVHDCVGLIKGYLWTNNGKLTYNALQDKDVSGMKAKCTVGNIEDLPEVKGLLVFMRGHVGVYIGNGEVIEARGHAYGVVKTKLKDRPWTEYGKLSWITYEEENMDEEKELTIQEKCEVIKQYYSLDDNTCLYFQFYRYNVPLIDKLYQKAKNGLK